MCRRSIEAILILLLTCALPKLAMAQDTEPRTWKDATGSFSVEAEFVDFVDGKLRLKKTDGQVITVALEQLSAADQQYVRTRTEKAAEEDAKTIAATALVGKPEELKNDDGTPAGKKSLPHGIAAVFKTLDDGYYITALRIHGGRYGYPQAPKEDFHVSLCDTDFELIADFTYPYSKFARGDAKWVELRCKPTALPRDFVVCLNFNPTSTKGVYVSHDSEGEGLVGLPGKQAGSFTGGDWMIRVTVDRLKAEK
ncbi:MAG: SHD1 domain-containing protein [Pirellulaceae bacterium]